MKNVSQYVSNAVNKFANNEDGLTTVEYAVAGTLITLAVVTAFGNLGSAIGVAIAKITAVLTAP